MKETFYFSHDYGARNDPKLQNVLMDLGCEGIGIYWCLVEMLFEQDGKIDTDQIRGIAFNLHVSEEIVQDVVGKYGLFHVVMENDVQYFFSDSVNSRLAERRRKKEVRRMAGIRGNQVRWGGGAFANASQSDTDLSQMRQNSIAKPSLCDNNASQNIAKERKVKESKQKENITPPINPPQSQSRFVKPTLEEVETYISEKGYSVDAERFISYYESNGWKVGRNPMKNWMAAVSNWERMEKTRNGTRNGKTDSEPQFDFGRGSERTGEAGYEDSF